MNKLRNLSIAKLAIMIAALGFFAFGCSNTGQTDENAVDSTLSVEDQAEKLVYPMPTPLEITDMLNKAGASYIIGISNRPEYVDKYFTESAKALNLGVYGADLSYSATYEMSQETMNFFMCTKKLRDGLDIQTPGNENVSNRIEANIENKDSIYNILTTSFTTTFDYLNDNGKGAVAVMVLAGGFVEGLYLSTELASMIDKNSDILQGIADQKVTLDKLMPLMETYKENQNVSDVLKNLSTIKLAYDELKTVDNKVTMTTDSFKKIRKEVGILRKKVVETP
jgi:hypothetical protein